MSTGDKNVEDTPYEHSLVDGFTHHIARAGCPCSLQSALLRGLARLQIAVQRSKSCDERSTNGQLQAILVGLTQSGTRLASPAYCQSRMNYR